MFARAGRFYFILIAIMLAGAVLVRIADPFFVQALRLIAFDSYQLLEPVDYDPNLPVRIIDIDEESLSRIGQWPWSRVVMADLLAKLANQGAASVSFDILFSEPDRTSPEEMIKLLPPEEATAVRAALGNPESHDKTFVSVVSQAPTVLATILTDRETPPPPPKAGFVVAGDDPRPFIPNFPGSTNNLPALDDAATGIGSINWIPDRDQVVRRVPLIYRIGDTFIPTLTTESLRVAQGASTYVLKGSNASGETAFGQQTGLNHIRVGDIEIPVDADGGIWLKFRHKNPASYIPAWKVLSGDNDPNDVAGRIILIGTSAPGLIDLRATPLDASIPGVEVHAQAIEHILVNRWLTRPDYALALELIVMVVLGLALSMILPHISAAMSAVLGAGVVAALLVGGWGAYEYGGLLFDPTYAAAAIFLLVTAATLYIYRRVEQQRGEVRRAFSYYVSPTVVDEIIANPDKLELGGEVRELTLLFCDVRNFTSISERLTAHELTHFINSLLTPLSEIILEHRGTIDKYMGDAIMAFWNAPLDDGDHARNACTSAMAMIARMADLNEQWRQEDEAAGRTFKQVAIGIGINSGDCCVGNLGSSQRFDYSVIGDNVNVASRFEGLSKFYGVPIVIGEPTLEKVPDLDAIELDMMRVKGREKPTRIYAPFNVLGAANGAFGDLQPRHSGMLSAYRACDWDAAEAAIGDCEALGIARLSTLYGVYRERIAEWRVDPPPPNWDGTFTATSK